MTLAKSLESVDSFIWDRSTKPSSDSMMRASPISPVFTSETFISSALGTSMVEGTSAANTDIPRQLAHRVQAKAARSEERRVGKERRDRWSATRRDDESQQGV